MKKSKIITILISLLIFSLLASAFATGAVGSGENVTETPYDAMVSLGYIDGLDRNDTLTRIDALIILFKLTGVESDAASYDGGAAFLDVDEEFSAYASYAADKGISLGDGYSFFSPFRPITLQEMLILTLRTLGYTEVDVSNVYELAKEAKLYIYTDQDELYYYLTAGRMAEILWNLLNTAPNGSDATYAELLIDLDELNESLYNKILATISYEFGDIPSASNDVLTEKMTQKPDTDENYGWSDVWRP